MSLVADSSGVVRGKFTVPGGVPAGSKLVSVLGAGGSKGDAVFSGQGTLERQTYQQQTTIVETLWQSPPPPTPAFENRGSDPLAQTFSLPNSIPASGVELWFVAKPMTTCRVQIRETTAGIPNGVIKAQKIVDPVTINIGGAVTLVPFESPVFLVGGIEYAIVVLCDDPIGSLSVAELGKFDSTAQKWITSQPYQVGVLLSSSNASTWTPHQDRDMAFRIKAASYTQTQRIVPLGTVAVTNATDLLLMAYADRPASETGVEYTLTLPDATVITVSDGQPVQLPAAITGNVTVAAKLTGSVNFAPVLHPGTQLVSGTIASTGTYLSRAIPAGTSVKIKVIVEAIIPSGASLGVAYKGVDIGDTFTDITLLSNRPVDDGFTEFVYQVTGVTETAVQVRLTPAGTTSARPRVRDLRVIVA